MMGKKQLTTKLFYNLSLEDMLPEDHIVRDLEQVLDLEFVRDLCERYYSHIGQPSVDPIVIFNMMILGYLYGIVSERRLAEECSLNMAFRWYVGYDLDEPTPHHSVLSKARARFGKQVFENFFSRVLSVCIEAGLAKREKVFVNGGLIQANASVKSLTRREDALSILVSPHNMLKERLKKILLKKRKILIIQVLGKAVVFQYVLKEPHCFSVINNRAYPIGIPPRVLRSSHRKKHKINLDYMSKTDPDSSFVYRPRIGRLFCYKDHLSIDSHKGVITAVAEDHILEELLKKQPL